MTESSFNIERRFVYELKAVLRAAGHNEGRDYEEGQFDPALRESGRHVLNFKDSRAAVAAKLTWDAHINAVP